MITPVVLIMASSSLIMSTSQRLSRSIERTRKITEALRTLIDGMEVFAATQEITMLLTQLRLSSRRARLLQKSMTVLYLTIFIFISSCISIAVVSIFFRQHPWIPLAIDIIGIGFLFLASIYLVRESRIAIAAVDQEMDYTLRLFQEKFSQSPPRTAWWKKLVSGSWLRRGKQSLKAQSDMI